MAKALKIAALVVGVAALAIVTGGAALGLGLALSTTALGVSAGTLLLVSGGLSLAAAVLTKAPKIPSSQGDRLNASIDPRTPRKTVFGSTAFPVDVRYEEWWGADQDYCDWVICHASHAIESLDEIWIDTELAWTLTGGAQGRYVGYLSVPHIVLEGSAGTITVGTSGKWTGRLTGCAYSHLRFKVTGNGKKAESPLSSGPPSRITMIGRGAKMYDPRRDSTVPGGSGPMRADDQSTWRFAIDGAVLGENLPLAILRHILGWRITDPATGTKKLATGTGLPAKRIDLQSYIIAANQADETVAAAGGGTEPRYAGAGVISEGEDPGTIFDALCAGCLGRFRDTGGKLSLVLAHDDLASVATDDGLFTDDVIGGFSWDPSLALDQLPTVVRGRYIDATTTGLYQPVDYPEVTRPTGDGGERPFPLELGYVESPGQAQRIATQVIERKQRTRTFVAPFDIRAWKYAVGDPVPFTFTPLGFERRLFRVADQQIGQDGRCEMTLTAEEHAIYAPPVLVAPTVAVAAVAYNPAMSPIVRSIGDLSFGLASAVYDLGQLGERVNTIEEGQTP